MGIPVKPFRHLCTPWAILRLTVQRPKPPGYPTHPATLGEHIKKARMDRGLRQKDVAVLLGVTTDTITYWETGRVRPTALSQEKIKGFLTRTKE